MDFYQLCSCCQRASGGFGESINNQGNLGHRHRMRRLIASGKRYGAGSIDRRPTAFARREWMASLPGLAGGIAPDTQIFGADPGISSDSSGFRHDQGCTAYGAGCQVNEMPVVGEAILAGILAHGRNKYSVAELNIAKAKRLE